jgi:hypothetical protein
MIGLLKMGDSHPELIKKFSEEGFLRLSKDEQEKMKEVFKTWRNKFTNESILSKSNSLISVKNLPDLRLLAEFNGASPEFMDVLRTPETAQYAVDAYKGDVVVPSGQAKSIVTQISSFIENITTAEKLLAPKKIENGSLLSLASEA